MVRYVKRNIAICMTSMIILAGILQSSCQRNELCKSNTAAGLNGSFETTDSGYPVNWAFFPSPDSGDFLQVSVDTSNIRDGKHSLKLVTKQSDGTTGFRSRRIPVQSGKKYNISFSVQNIGCTFKVNRIVQDSSGKKNLRAAIIAEVSTSSDWKKYEETLTVSNDEFYVILIFLVEGSGILWCDDVKVEELTEL